MFNSLLKLRHALVRRVRVLVHRPDRRRHPRFAVDAPCVVVRGSEKFECRIEDLSLGGAKLSGAVGLAAKYRGSLQIPGIATDLPFEVLDDNAGGRVRVKFASGVSNNAQLESDFERLVNRLRRLP